MIGANGTIALDEVSSSLVRTALERLTMPREPPSGRPAPIQLTRPVPSVQNALFCKEGEYWTIGYRGQAFRLKDTKGLAYLAHLLRHPTMEFHVLDVARGIARRQGEQDEHQSIHGLPRGDEDLEKAGIRITSLGDAG